MRRDLHGCYLQHDWVGRLGVVGAATRCGTLNEVSVRVVMSWDRGSKASFAFFLTLCGFSQAAFADIRCTLRHEGRALSDMDLFYGPPEEKASVEPQPGGYYRLNRPGVGVSAFLYLQCRYAGTDAKVTFLLPATVLECLFQKPDPEISCR